MKVRGIVSEISKKPKSYKMIINKKSYYCKEDVNYLAGKEIEAEYTESEPYDNPSKPGEKIQSKYIVFNTIKVLDGVTTPKPPESAYKVKETALNEPSNDIWLVKERHELRKTLWNAVYMTLYPVLSKSGFNRVDIVDTVNYYAEEGYKFTYKEMK